MPTSITDLPFELRISILEYLTENICDQISISVTCQLWQTILMRKKFQETRYSSLTPCGSIKIHRFFEGEDERLHLTCGCTRGATRQLRYRFIVSAATGKIIKCYYSPSVKCPGVKDALAAQQRVIDLSSRQIRPRNYDVSQCPFLDEPLMRLQPRLGVSEELFQMSRFAVNVRESEIRRYQESMYSHHYHEVRDHQYAVGHLIARGMLISTCDCATRPCCAAACFVRFRPIISDIPNNSNQELELQVKWPDGMNMEPSNSATVKQAAQAVISAFLSIYPTDNRAKGSDYVESFRFVAYNSTLLSIDRLCRIWRLGGTHYGPWKFIRRSNGPPRGVDEDESVTTENIL